MSTVTATKPGQVVKKALTVTQAEAQWVKADEQEALAKLLKAEAAAVLEPHLEKRGLTRYKRVELVTAKSSRVLDQKAVKQYLGRKVERFMKWTNPSPRLSRIADTTDTAAGDSG